tara:strand:+ start:1019 stop:1486 length:468 start_codon:yes stop_codon:yes gene_type:complete
MVVLMKKGFTKANFYAMLEPNGDCLEWTGWCDRDGYGRTATPHLETKYQATHRLTMLLENVDITDKVVMHRCDNRKCCNPEHLMVGTQAENVIDMTEKRRHAQGIGHPMAKLNEEQVLDIRSRVHHCAAKDLAIEYNVSHSTISAIKHRHLWKYI